MQLKKKELANGGDEGRAGETGKRRADTPTRKPSKFLLWFRAYGARFVFLTALPGPVLAPTVPLPLSHPRVSVPHEDFRDRAAPTDGSH